MDEPRNQSEEPLSTTQEEVRKLRREGDEAVSPSSKLPEEVQFIDPGKMLDELVEVADVVPEPLTQNPLGPPERKKSPVEAVADVPLKSLKAVQGAGAFLDDLAHIANPRAAPLPEMPEGPKKPAPTPEPFSPQRAAQKRAEHGAVMVELAENARAQVPDAQPVDGVQMARGELERLTFQGGERPEMLTDAYKRYVESDKEYRATLAQLLLEHASALRQMRLELDLIRGYLERDCI